MSFLHFFAQACDVSGATGDVADTCLPEVIADQDTVSNVLAVVFAVLGGIAVIMIIIGAIQFVTSQGDSQSVAKARQTIIYAFVGLVVAISAEVIVYFLLRRL